MAEVISSPTDPTLQATTRKAALKACSDSHAAAMLRIRSIDNAFISTSRRIGERETLEQVGALECLKLVNLSYVASCLFYFKIPIYFKASYTVLIEKFRN